MKWVTAGVTFVNLSVVCGLFLGLAGRGFNTSSAALALVCGAAFAVAALLGTRDGTRNSAANRLGQEQKQQKVSEPEEPQNAGIPSALMRYRRVWFWAVAICFAMFAVRSFCWLLYIDGSELKIQSPNNLGDLSLHLTLIKNFANGVALWQDSPIFDVLGILPLGRHVCRRRLFVQRWHSRISVFQDLQVFGLSGYSGRHRPQTDRLEEHCVIDARYTAGVALRNPCRVGAALALASKILQPVFCSRGRRPRLSSCG